jgi:uncharacterized OB-fold protein
LIPYGNHSARAFCPKIQTNVAAGTFERCDSWVEAGTEGVIEASTIVVRGFEGKRKSPVAIAFVRLDGIDSAIANYVDGLDLSDYEEAMKKLAPGTRVRSCFRTLAKAALPISALFVSIDTARQSSISAGPASVLTIRNPSVNAFAWFVHRDLRAAFLRHGLYNVVLNMQRFRRRFAELGF